MNFAIWAYIQSGCLQLGQPLVTFGNTVAEPVVSLVSYVIRRPNASLLFLTTVRTTFYWGFEGLVVALGAVANMTDWQMRVNQAHCGA